MYNNDTTMQLVADTNAQLARIAESDPDDSSYKAPACAEEAVRSSRRGYDGGEGPRGVLACTSLVPPAGKSSNLCP